MTAFPNLYGTIILVGGGGAAERLVFYKLHDKILNFLFEQ